MDLHEEIGQLTAPLLHRVLFVCLSEPVAGAKEILPHLPDHLRHLVAMEKSGALVASGPFLEAGQIGLRSMMIIRAKDVAEARQIAEKDLSTSSVCDASRSRNGS